MPKKQTCQLCEFHKYQGHINDMCRALKNKIQDHVDKGNLSPQCKGGKPIIGSLTYLIPPTRTMINVVIAKIQASVTNGQRRQENKLNKEEIERINQTHGFDFTDMINIITDEEKIQYRIRFSDRNMDGVFEPYNYSILIESNIQGWDIQKYWSMNAV